MGKSVITRNGGRQNGFHYALKPGYGVEKLQERSMDKTTLLVLTYSVIAVVIMNMTYIARIYPEEPCAIFFEEDDMEGIVLCSKQARKKPIPPIRYKKQ